MRFDTDRLKEIVDTITRNKSRSLLTGFGVFWGIFMLLAMMGGGNGLKEILSSNFDGFATNSGLMAAESTSKPYKGFKKGRTWSLNMTDLGRLRSIIPELDIVTPMVSSWNDTIIHSDKKVQGFANGVEADYAKVQEPQLKYGRYINEVDVQQKRHVCVIGKKIYNNLFPEGGDPCGKMVQFKGSWYKVIGVDYKTSNINIGGPSDQAFVIPLSVLRQVLNRGENIDVICTTVKEGFRFSEIEEKIRQTVYRQHVIAPDDKDAMMVFNAEQIFTLLDNIFKGVSILVWLIGLGTVLAGAIGVSNIMMVTVKERTTEIGIRRAIGATPGMILSQIMEESVMLTTLSGTLGILFAVLILNMCELAATKDGVLMAHFQIGFWTAVGVLAMLTVLGILAGLAPAMRAMAIKPVDAMHDE